MKRLPRHRLNPKSCNKKRGAASVCMAVYPALCHPPPLAEQCHVCYQSRYNGPTADRNQTHNSAQIFNRILRADDVERVSRNAPMVDSKLLQACFELPQLGPHVLQLDRLYMFSQALVMILKHPPRGYAQRSSSSANVNAESYHIGLFDRAFVK